jgi:fatty-acyl-CoA synthase
MLGVGMSWTSGAALVIRRKFSARNFWRDISLYECSVIQYIGELCRYLTLHAPSEYDRKHKIRVAIGNGLRPDVWSKFQERFNIPTIGEFYGATEGNCALLNLRNKFGSIGNLPVWVSKLGLAPFYLFKFDVENETVIRDAQGRCIRCAPNEVGEMLGKIEPDKNPLSRFDGYSNKDATEKKILRNVEVEGDQWFRTGDLLYYDKSGNYYFVDRIGDTFRWKGENVSTNEVAEVLAGVKGTLSLSFPFNLFPWLQCCSST